MSATPHSFEGSAEPVAAAIDRILEEIETNASGEADPHRRERLHELRLRYQRLLAKLRNDELVAERMQLAS